MGIQDKKDVYLIRHAYVMTTKRNKGIGSQLLKELVGNSNKPILIGTWRAASWAIGFYIKHGFALVSDMEKEILLRKFLANSRTANRNLGRLSRQEIRTNKE